jgi:hypothetical protein
MPPFFQRKLCSYPVSKISLGDVELVHPQDKDAMSTRRTVAFTAHRRCFFLAPWLFTGWCGSTSEADTLEDEEDLSDSALQDDTLRPEFVLVVVEQGSDLEADDTLEHEEDFSPAQEVTDIMSELREHVKRIHAVDHKSPDVADYLSCAFIALLEHGTIHCRQEHLNAVKDAILPLLDLSRFEERYVLRPPWEWVVRDTSSYDGISRIFIIQRRSAHDFPSPVKSGLPSPPTVLTSAAATPQGP